MAAEAISDDEVSVLYESNILGISSAEALINTVWLMNSIHFGLRGCDEHRQMCWSDVKLLRDADGTEYLEYCERQNKTRSGEEPRNIRPVKPKAFARPDGPREKDPDFAYKFYSEKRPSSMQTVEALYYLGINHSKDSSKWWFKASPMRVNKLTSLMKTMTGKAGIERRLTNHSSRKRMMQKLNDNNVPPTHIMQLSGHRNLQSVNNYSTLSKEQQKNMSLILSDNSAPSNTAHTAKTSQTVATAESSFTNSSVIPASGAFSGAVFHGGHFNITINTLNKSPNTSKCSVSTVARSYKRIKRVLDSSDDSSPPAVPFQ